MYAAIAIICMLGQPCEEVQAPTEFPTLQVCMQAAGYFGHNTYLKYAALGMKAESVTLRCEKSEKS